MSGFDMQYPEESASRIRNLERQKFDMVMAMAELRKDLEAFKNYVVELENARDTYMTAAQQFAQEIVQLKLGNQFLEETIEGKE
jgi:hypothetical protein